MSLANWPNEKRRVVVTGLGVISPLGHTLAETWKALLAGKSAAAPITLFDAKEYVTNFACEVRNFVPDAVVSSKDQRKMDRFIQLGLVASIQAWEDAGFKGRSRDHQGA